MTWLGLAYALLKFVNNILDWAERHRYITEGKRLQFEDELKRSLAIMTKTKKAQEETETWDENKLDDFLTKP